MGIRFCCASCSKWLNVKGFLAGKRGICPHCGATVDIPLKSEPDPGTSPECEENVTETPVEESFPSYSDHPASPVWYVRRPSGGQFGPASSDLLLKWVKEDRVQPDDLIWREGWPDWQIASLLFPDL